MAKVIRGWRFLDLLEHNGQSGRSGGTPAVFVSLSSSKDEPARSRALNVWFVGQ
jgi:hypothetical protein